MSRPFITSIFSGACLWLALWFALANAPVLAQAAPLAVYTVQGEGAVSPYWQQRVDVYGMVTGVTPTGFYLQDPVGDGRSTTSDGIFVYSRTRPTVQVNDCVEVTGAYVDEFYAKTELSRARSIVPADRCVAATVTAAALPLLVFDTQVEAQFEALEGMRVAVRDLAGVVQGPTKRYDSGDVELSLLPAHLVPYLQDGRVHQAAAGEMTALVYLSGLLGATLPDADWGDTVEIDSAEAILDYNFGKYQLLLLPGAGVEHQPEPGRRPVEAGAELAGDGDFTVCSFNLFGMGSGTAQYTDAGEYATQLDRRAQVIADVLGGCTVIGVQELGTLADGQALAAQLQASRGLAYTLTALPGPQTANVEFPLTNGLLTRTDRVQVVAAAVAQGCSAFDYGVEELPGTCPAGHFPLFDRPPLVVDLQVAGAWGEPLPLRVVVNHWKSKGGDEAANAPRRLAQAEHVVTLVQQVLDVDPAAAVVVLGDLNDYYVSAPVEALRTGTRPPLQHLGEWLPEGDRYSYIFNGGSQMLDHLLVSQGLAGQVSEVNVLHVDADYATRTAPLPLRHVSDHDPWLVRIRPGAAIWLGGNLGYAQIAITAKDRAGNTLAATTTDARGDFRLWNLAPGWMRLHLAAPAHIALPRQVVTATLATGAHQLHLPMPAHATVIGGVATITATVSFGGAGP